MLLEDCGARMVVTMAGIMETVSLAKPFEVSILLDHTGEVSMAQIAGGRASDDSLGNRGSYPVTSEGECYLFYTSGSTGYRASPGP